MAADAAIREFQDLSKNLGKQLLDNTYQSSKTLNGMNVVLTSMENKLTSIKNLYIQIGIYTLTALAATAFGTWFATRNTQTPSTEA